MPFGQMNAADGARLFGRHAMCCHQPLVQANRVLLFGHRLDDRPLHASVEMRPARAEAIFVAKRGEYLVAGPNRAIVASLVTAFTTGESQPSCQSGMVAGRSCGFGLVANRISLMEHSIARRRPHP